MIKKFCSVVHVSANGAQPCVRSQAKASTVHALGMSKLMLVCVCRVGKQIVNVPSFMVRVDSQKHIDFALNSPFGGGRPGRNKRKALKCVPQSA